uniref:Uncharacterized protein n=1 Tax=Rhipicephalus appendiculatus TaxID=34631 RepID=A0A131YFP4_RHIAP
MLTSTILMHACCKIFSKDYALHLCKWQNYIQISNATKALFVLYIHRLILVICSPSFLLPWDWFLCGMFPLHVLVTKISELQV